MDIENMFIILVNIVLIALMVVQSGNALGYLYSIIFVFVQVVLLVSLLNSRTFNIKQFYLLLCIILGFLFLVMYLVFTGDALTNAFGHVLIVAFFVGIILLFGGKKSIKHDIEIYSGDDLPKPIPPKKNLFETLEQKHSKTDAKKLESDLRRQAKELVAAEKKLNKITRRLSQKTAPKRAKKTKKKATKKKAAKKPTKKARKSTKRKAKRKK